MSENRLIEEVLANRLDAALPAGSSVLSTPTPADPLVSMAVRVAMLTIPEPSELALMRIEARVLAAFDQQHQQTRRWLVQAGRWLVAASLVIVLLVGAAVPASANSLPGEPLYAVKRLAEQVELAFATAPEAAALVRLTHAERRAQEATALFVNGQPYAAVLLEAQTELNAARQAATAELRASADFSMQQERITDLIQSVGPQPTPEQVPPTATTVPTVMPTSTPTPSATPSATETATRTPSRTPTATRTPTLTATVTNVLPTAPPVTPVAGQANEPQSSSGSNPGQAPPAATNCPGNSCSSAGVPGGQVNPDAPPGQSGGRADNPPDPPGQGNPGPAQGNADNPGNSGGNPPQGPPPSNAGGGGSSGANDDDDGGSGNSGGDRGGGGGNGRGG